MAINLDRYLLKNLKFADDVVIIASKIEELENMLQQLHKASKTIGLKSNIHQTKTKTTIDTPIIIDNRTIVNYEYIYLVHAIKIRKENERVEIRKRIKAS